MTRRRKPCAIKSRPGQRMTLRNTTDLPDALVRAIVRFVKPSNVVGFSLTVRNTSSWYPHGHAAARSRRSRIVVSIPTRRHVPASSGRGAYLRMPPRSRVEALVRRGGACGAPGASSPSATDAERGIEKI